MNIESDLAREGITIAPASKRVKAYILDELLISLVVLAAAGGDIFRSDDLMARIAALNSCILWVIPFRFIYQLTFVSIYGSTLGKMWQRVTIVSINGLEKPSFSAALARTAVRIASDACLAYGFLWAFLNPLRQTWHDKAAETIVIDV